MNDSEFKELLEVYKREHGNNNYLAERFTKFILEYCPVKEWQELKHPLNHVIQITDEQNMKFSWLTEKRWDIALINYRLVSFINRKSIINYLKNITERNRT